jgi:hypothetical protein
VLGTPKTVFSDLTLHRFRKDGWTELSKEGDLMLKRTLLLALAVASLVMLHPARAEALPLISAGTSFPGPTPGTFIVPIEITDAVELINWQFDLAFDPAVVQINEACDPFTDSFCGLLTGPVTEGPFTQGPFSLFVPGVIDNNNGLLSIVAGAFQDLPPAPSGDGILAYVEFITIDDTGNPNIRVTDFSTVSSAVPEPATLFLMGSGLLILGAGRISKRIRGKKS